MYVILFSCYCMGRRLSKIFFSFYKDKFCYDLTYLLQYDILQQYVTHLLQYDILQHYVTYLLPQYGNATLCNISAAI